MEQEIDADYLWLRIRRLTGRVFFKGDKSSAADISNAIDYLGKCIKHEKLKARTNSPFYNTNRHINLHECVFGLKQLAVRKQHTPF